MRFIPELAFSESGDARPRPETPTPLGTLKHLAAELGLGRRERIGPSVDWAAWRQTYAYATAYNLAVFEKRRAAVLRACPEAFVSSNSIRTDG